MSSQLSSPIETEGMKVRTLKAPGNKQLHSFGASGARITRIAPVAANAPYQPQIAYLNAVISGWAYSDADTLASQLPYYGLPECTVHEIQVVNRAMLVVAAAYFVRSADGRVGVLAFRGTVPDDFINWLTDANTHLRPFHGVGQVHTGFYQNVEPLWGQIVESLENALVPESDGGNGQTSLKPLENLYITGHSLGAAMAVIAAARIFTKDYRHLQSLVRGVYTYGQPAAGDHAFGEHYGRQFALYRHVYDCDVVPHLPPTSVGRFRHFGQEFYSTGDAWKLTTPPRVKQIAFVTAAAASAMFDFVSRRVLLLRRLQLPYSLDDHGPTGYIDASRAGLSARQ